MKSQNGAYNGYKKMVDAAVTRRELTEREYEVLRLVVLGYKNREIAKELGVAVRTVVTHRVNIMNKLGLRNLAQLIHYAIQKGILRTENE